MKNAKKYRWENMPDHSMEGIKKEVQSGLTTMAVYYSTTHGIPVEMFNERMSVHKTLLESLMLYLNFRNEHPKLFK